ncbi:KOW motif-containing protein [Streptomyces sp. Amel2xB2]|uniref:KOW motif-containing protein n=1 Tax=Streptomyces sp. Amel2xB2 TaxID=1305829 RepID=UPI000DB9B143|nr:KOW motif-containing protein [Streptomyces sp. Amel2xB2]RAJ70259.1 KOW motif-containing protein [Streptomyces sp. Amel2xB2]
MKRGDRVRITAGRHEGETGVYIDDYTAGRVIPGMAFEDESNVRLDDGSKATVPTASLAPATKNRRRNRDR